MTITIKNKDFSSNINLATIMNVMTKVEMLKRQIKSSPPRNSSA